MLAPIPPSPEEQDVVRLAHHVSLNRRLRSAPTGPVQDSLHPPPTYPSGGISDRRSDRTPAEPRPDATPDAPGQRHPFGVVSSPGLALVPKAAGLVPSSPHHLPYRSTPFLSGSHRPTHRRGGFAHRNHEPSSRYHSNGQPDLVPLSHASGADSSAFLSDSGWPSPSSSRRVLTNG